MKMLVMVPERNRHLDEEQLENYSLGVISEKELSQFEEHLLICEDCRQQLAETQAYVVAMQAASAQLGAAQTRQRWPWVVFRFAPILAAGLAILAIAVGLRVFLHRGAVPAVAVALAATRGPVMATAPAGTPLVLLPDLEGLPVLASYHLEMVDHAGKWVWQGAVAPGAGKSENGRNGAAPGAPAGLYFVRVYDPSGVLLREFGLQVGKPR